GDLAHLDLAVTSTGGVAEGDTGLPGVPGRLVAPDAGGPCFRALDRVAVAGDTGAAHHRHHADPVHPRDAHGADPDRQRVEGERCVPNVGRLACAHGAGETRWDAGAYYVAAYGRTVHP